jgi:DHA2 family multidrug resistance protein
MGVGGLTMFLSGPIVGRIVARYPPRMLMVAGMGIAAVGLWTGHALTPEWGFAEFAVLQATRAFGIMTAMIASQQVSMATLPLAFVKNASGILNLARNVGGAMGLAMLSTMIGVSTLDHSNDLHSRISEADPQGQAMFAGLVQRMTDMGVADPEGAARKAMSFMIEKQAMSIAFGEAFAFLAVLTIIAGCFAFLTKPPPRTVMSAPMESH